MINRTQHDQAMSRSTIWRVLDEADLKPRRSVYWLNSHDPDFDAKAHAICRLNAALRRCASPIGSVAQTPRYSDSRDF